MNQIHNKKQLLIISKRKALSDLAREIRPTDVCYYMDDDYLTLAMIRKTLSPKYEICLFGKRLHEVITEIRDDFLHLFYEISQKNVTDIYWDTHLASRNSASVPILKNIVYLLCAGEVLSRTESRIIIICDSPALAKTLEDEAKRMGYSCRFIYPRRHLMRLIELYMKIAIRGVYFLVIAFILWIYAKFLNNERIDRGSKSPVCILRSWLTVGSIDKQGHYRDRNFGELPDYLKREGENVWILPMFVNLDKNRFSLMKLLTKSPHQFIFPEQYLSLLDLFNTFCDGIKSIFLNLDKCELRGRDVGPIIKEAHLATCFSVQLLLLNSVKYLIEKLKKNGIIVERFIYPLENNASEKTFIIATRKWFPNALIVGFQHSVWFKEHFGVFMASEEACCHPLPDKIVVSGKRYLDILKQTGIPETLLSLGPNLRFTSINKSMKTGRKDVQVGPKSILLILNFDPNHSLELLEKTTMALQGITANQVYIKAHPLYPVKALEVFLHDIRFPPYCWAEGTVQEWISRASVVMMTGGSVSNLETMVAGVPLIRISLENNFDFDCLWDEYPFSPFTSSAQEIRYYLEQALRMSSEEKERLVEFGRYIVHNYFEPVTPDNMKVFL